MRKQSDGLSPFSRVIYKDAVRRGQWPPGRQVVLAVALEALDDLTAIRNEINSAGRMIRTRRGTDTHPLMQAELELRDQFIRLWSLAHVDA